MFLVGILTWWYGDGWRKRAIMIGGRISRTSDYFSIGLLLATLFSPFRQISAGTTDGPFAAQLRGLLDKLISRLIGAIVRIFMIFFGIVTICLQAIFGGIELVSWAIIPAFPVVGLIMVVIGWVPAWL